MEKLTRYFTSLGGVQNHSSVWGSDFERTFGAIVYRFIDSDDLNFVGPTKAVSFVGALAGVLPAGYSVYRLLFVIEG